MEEGKSVGGLPRIAHIIRTTRKNYPNVLVVDAGDIFQGTGYFENYQGETDVECLNRAGYDVYTIGNHEFDVGSANLGKLLKRAKFDVVDCNLDVSAEPDLRQVVKHSVVKEIGGQKVGFIGVITPVLKELAPLLGGVKVIEPGPHWMDPVIAEVDKLKKQGVNKIILVSHCGTPLETQLAQIPDVDVVIGAHSHTRLDKAIVIDHPDGSKAMVVQTGCYGRALGRLDLVFDNDGKLIMPETKYRLIDITDRIFEEPDLKAYVTEKAEPFIALTKTILASAEANFGGKLYPTDSPMGDLVCDAYVDACSKYGATISLQNRGGIRGSFEQGPINLERVHEILPFVNELTVATVTGKTLLNALENSVKVASGGLGGRFLEVHGLKFAWDPALEQGHHIVYAYAENKEGRYEPVVAENLYRIVINSFSFKGGEEYDFKGAKDVVDTGLKMSNTVADYLKKMKKVSPLAPERILSVSSTIARRKTDDKNDLITIDYPCAGSELSVVAGSDRGVSFLNKVGVVPLTAPRLVRTMKTDESGHLEIPVSSLSADGQKKSSDEHLWLSMVLKARDKGGNTARIVSVPMQIH